MDLVHRRIKVTDMVARRLADMANDSKLIKDVQSHIDDANRCLSSGELDIAHSYLWEALNVVAPFCRGLRDELEAHRKLAEIEWDECLRHLREGVDRLPMNCAATAVFEKLLLELQHDYNAREFEAGASNFARITLPSLTDAIVTQAHDAFRAAEANAATVKELKDKLAHIADKLNAVRDVRFMSAPGVTTLADRPELFVTRLKEHHRHVIEFAKGATNDLWKSSKAGTDVAHVRRPFFKLCQAVLCKTFFRVLYRDVKRGHQQMTERVSLVLADSVFSVESLSDFFREGTRQSQVELTPPRAARPAGISRRSSTPHNTLSVTQDGQSRASLAVPSETSAIFRIMPLRPNSASSTETGHRSPSGVPKPSRHALSKTQCATVAEIVREQLTNPTGRDMLVRIITARAESLLLQAVEKLRISPPFAHYSRNHAVLSSRTKELAASIARSGASVLVELCGVQSAFAPVFPTGPHLSNVDFRCFYFEGEMEALPQHTPIIVCQPAIVGVTGTLVLTEGLVEANPLDAVP